VFGKGKRSSLTTDNGLGIGQIVVGFISVIALWITLAMLKRCINGSIRALPTTTRRMCSMITANQEQRPEEVASYNIEHQTNLASDTVSDASEAVSLAEARLSSGHIGGMKLPVISREDLVETTFGDGLADNCKSSIRDLLSKVSWDSLDHELHHESQEWDRWIQVNGR
jgi:hypothetical protein